MNIEVKLRKAMREAEVAEGELSRLQRLSDERRGGKHTDMCGCVCRFFFSAYISVCVCRFFSACISVCVCRFFFFFWGGAYMCVYIRVCACVRLSILVCASLRTYRCVYLGMLMCIFVYGMHSGVMVSAYVCFCCCFCCYLFVCSCVTVRGNKHKQLSK